MQKILVLVLTINAGCVMANDSNSAGVYFNLGLGASKVDNLPTGAATVNMNWGYDFNRGLAVEAGWSGMPQEQWGELSNYNIYDVAVKGSIPLSQSFALYSRLGVGAAYSSWSGTSGSPIYYDPGSAWSMVGLVGIGAAFTLNRSFSLYLENNNYLPISSVQTGAYGYASSLMFGFQYKFGSSAKTLVADNDAVIPAANPVSLTQLPIMRAVQSESAVMSEVVEFAPTHKVNAFADRIKIDSKGKYIIVKRGDTLRDISCGTDVYITTLQEVNQIKGSKLRDGVKLYLGNTQYPTPIEIETFNKRVKEHNGRKYIEVICGDTLSEISSVTGISIKSLIQLNHLQDMHEIVVGHRVYLD